MTQRTLVLDLDGTLVDSAADLARALNGVFRARGIPPAARAEVTSWIGHGAPALLAQGFAARGVTQDAAALDEFLADYTAHAAQATQPFPGVAETLAALAARGWRLAVCTNKPEAAARALLGALGLAGWFAAIGGGDSFATRKPDPAHLLGTLAAAGGAATRALMVGDHENDVLAAKGAGVPCIFAAWGYGPPTMAAGAAAIAPDFLALAALCEQFMP